MLGPQHPDVAITLNNLAILYYYTERCNEALPLFKCSLKIFESKPGSAHPYFKMIEQSIEVLKAKTEEK
ncbi:MULTISPECIES: tetratricopeptide repeat protein [unclassified Methanosarcina]|uniref:tetratricopeptide repeat protein n=1 Tax=unclassified Methanosarcina TaxID=2644672 RepID=UPI000698B1FF